jgi:CheY-like chemotaxis protein
MTSLAETPPPPRPLPTILLVEDNEDDVLITKRAFAKGNVSNPVIVARDGDEALDCLYRRGAFKGVIRPALVLLDLNLPTLDGFSVLKAIKADPDIGSIPVIVLTTSKRDEDVVRAYQYHANSYLEKPVEFEKFVRVIQSFDLYWNRTAKLPPSTEEDLHAAA